MNCVIHKRFFFFHHLQRKTYPIRTKKRRHLQDSNSIFQEKRRACFMLIG
jgi:hypothetical protein